MEAASKCYESLCSEEFAIAGKCDVARKTLIDSLIAKFKESMHDFFAEVCLKILSYSDLLLTATIILQNLFLCVRLKSMDFDNGKLFYTLIDLL